MSQEIPQSCSKSPAGITRGGSTGHSSHPGTVEAHRGQPRGQLVTITPCRHRQKGDHTSLTAQPAAENLSWEQGQPPAAHHSQQRDTLVGGRAGMRPVGQCHSTCPGKLVGPEEFPALQDPGPPQHQPFGPIPPRCRPQLCGELAIKTAQGKVIQNTKPAQLCLLGHGHLCLSRGSLGHGTASPCALVGRGFTEPPQPSPTTQIAVCAVGVWQQPGRGRLWWLQISAWELEEGKQTSRNVAGHQAAPSA